MLFLPAPVLFGCSGPGAGEAIATNVRHSLMLAAVTAVLTYVCLRLWAESRWIPVFPAVCGFLLFFHPVGSVSVIHGDCGTARFQASLFVAAIAGLCVVAQWLVGPRLSFFTGPPERRPTNPDDARIYAGEPPQHDRPASEGASRWYDQELSFRILIANVWHFGLIRYATAIAFVGYFAFRQYEAYLQTRYQYQAYLQTRDPDYLGGPSWVLGPLYFLLNQSPADDWIGYALLAVAVPCILSVAVRPNRWTALVASLVGWAWVIPGTVKELIFW